MKAQPPRRALQFLRWFCREDYLDEIEGDLIELFEKRNLESPRSSRWLFTWGVLKHFRPEFIQLRGRAVSNPFFMTQNYIRTSVRNLRKQKLYSAINIGGLAVGLACFILVLLYVQHEFSFDRFYKNGDRIHYIYQRQAGNFFLGTDFFSATPGRLAPVLMDEIEAVAEATSITRQSSLIAFEEKNLWEEGIMADSNYFRVFELPFINGNPEYALHDRKSIVLTKSLAIKIFDSAEPVGQSVRYGTDTLHVTGVIADMPANSTFQFSFIVSMYNWDYYAEEMKVTTWKNNNVLTFFLLAEHAKVEDVQKRFPEIIKKYQDPKAYAKYPFKDEYFAEPITDVHFHTGINMSLGVRVNPRYVYLFAVVALIVLLVACINYMNLAIARSVGRAREVGLRKVVGAVRRQLTLQFLGESVFISCLALVLAIGIAYLLLPEFSRIVERQISLDFYHNRILLPGLATLVVVVGLLSGSYPALIMSALRPVEVLKGKVGGRLTGTGLQRWLIVVQYSASIVMIVASVVIFQQIKYMQDKDLGYVKDQIIAIPLRDYGLFGKYEVLKNQWLENPDVLKVSSTIHLPTNITSSTIVNDDDAVKENDLIIYEYRADYDVLDVFGIQLMAGRSFSRDVASDVDEGYLINESAAKAMGWTPEEAIGKQFTHEGTETVIGVVKDFHMHSMHIAIAPLFIRLYPSWGNYFVVKVRPDNLSSTIEFLERTTRAYSSYPFEYRFLDDHFNELYKNEERMSELFGLLTGLSILISSVGLFGLAAFITGQRVREMSIRKVLGASSASIVLLLTKNFLGLVGLAFLIAVPISWWAMSEWLHDFAYHIDLHWWIFALAGAFAVLVANVAIGYQSFKVSVRNPVDSLKSE